MAWIKSDQAVQNHPKTLDLMSAMGWDLDTAIGKLHRFWYWCVDYAEDGDLRKHNDARIGVAVGLNGDAAKQFVEAMVLSRWIDRKPYFRVHDWWDHNGPFLLSKYKHKPEMWQRVRDKYKPRERNSSKNSSKTETDTNPTLPYQPTKPTNPPRRAGARGAGGAAAQGVGEGESGRGEGNLAVDKLEVQSLLARAKVNPETQSKLLQRKDVTSGRIREILRDIESDGTVSDVPAVLVHRLNQRAERSVR